MAFLALAVAGPVELLVAARAFADEGEHTKPDTEPSQTQTP